MALYGELNVNIDALQRWVTALSVDSIDEVEVGGQSLEMLGLSKELLENQLFLFSESIRHLKYGDNWTKCLYCLSTAAYNAFFKVKNGAIRIANFYEALIKPGNSKTYKKIIKGFDELTIGNINVMDGGTCVASIGQKSDLIWQVFYDYFINREEPEMMIHTHANHEKYMSIQLFNIENKTQEEIDHIITEILLKISIEYDMDFKLVELDANYKTEGEANNFTVQFHDVEYEYIPSLYFNNGLRSDDARLTFLSFYQVIEYYFVRAQNYAFLYEYNQLPTTIDHSSLRNVLQKYKNSLNERESLRLVLKRALDISAFKTWIQSDAYRISIYCSGNTLKIDLSKSDDKIIGKLVERIYSFRCSIAHAKGDIDEYIAIPMLSDKDIVNELPLVKYIAFEVLKKCSEL